MVVLDNWIKLSTPNRCYALCDFSPLFTPPFPRSQPFRATGRLVLGLELALLLLLVCGVTHAHTEPELPAAAASAQISPGDATGLAADAGQHLPPAIDAKTDDSAGKSVVVNWKLACKQLCRWVQLVWLVVWCRPSFSRAPWEWNSERTWCLECRQKVCGTIAETR